jgi:hypothetical protein
MIPLKFKFSEKVLVPAEVLTEDKQIITSDGVAAEISYRAAYREDANFERLHELSNEMYGMAFPLVRQIWGSRLNGLRSLMWYVIQLKRI